MIPTMIQHTLELPGTYALLLRSRRTARVPVGALGEVRIEPGLYLGSALGPGGLRARLARHAALDKPQRWHVDHLRPFVTLAGAWFSTSRARLEHEWAERMPLLPAAGIAAPRFGASDCRCASHLIRFPDSRASFRSIAEALGASGTEPVGQLGAEALRELARRRSRLARGQIRASGSERR